MLRFTLILILLIINCSCTKEQRVVKTLYSQPSFFTICESISDELLRNLREQDIFHHQCLLTTFVELDDVKKSSTFGRLLSEGIGNSLIKRGLSILEIKSDQEITVDPRTGELILSRNPNEVGGQLNAKYVITGTYTIGANSVLISARIMELPEKKIISATLKEILKTPQIAGLLSDRTNLEAMPTGYDTMPSDHKKK